MESRAQQILDDLLLPVHEERGPGQLSDRQAVALAVGLQLDPVVNQRLPCQPVADAAGAQEIDRSRFEQSGPNPVFDVSTSLAFQDDRLDAVQAQEVGEEQSRRTRADDPDLGARGVDRHRVTITRGLSGSRQTHAPTAGDQSTHEPTRPSTQEPTRPSTQEPTRPSTHEPTRPSTHESTQLSTQLVLVITSSF